MSQKDRWKLEDLRRNVYDLQKTVENFLEKKTHKTCSILRYCILRNPNHFPFGLFLSLSLPFSYRIALLWCSAKTGAKG